MKENEKIVTNKVDKEKKYKIIKCGAGYKTLLEVTKNFMRYFEKKEDIYDYIEKTEEGKSLYSEYLKIMKMKE